jgi:RHS repeat-associated protein
VSTATAADAQSPDAVTTLPQTPEDTLGKLQNALYQSYWNTGWSDATYHLLILTANQYAVVTGTFDPQIIVQTMYDFFGITPSAGAIQVLDDRAQAVDAGLGILSSPSDTSTIQNVQTVGEPIDLFSGQFVLENDDVVVQGAGIDCRFHRVYRSKVVYDGPLGANWSHSYNLWIAELGDTMLLRATPDLREDLYVRHPKFGTAGFDYWVPPDGTHSVIVRDGTSFACLAPDGTKHRYEFNPSLARQHLLSRIEDRFGNYLAFQYDGDGRLEQILVNHTARVLTVVYDADDRIRTITDWTGRVWRYDYDDDGDLVGFAQPAADAQGSPLTTYEYETPAGSGSFPHNLVRVTDPAGRTYLENEYGRDSTRLDYNRVVRQRIAAGEIHIGYEAVVDDFDVTYTDVERPAIQVNLIERNGQVVHSVFNQFGNLLLREELVRTTSGLPDARWRYRYNADGARTAVLSPEGRLRQIYYVRDDFIRRREITDADVPTDPTLTMDIRLSFGNVLATVERSGRFDLTNLNLGRRVWGHFPDVVAGVAADDVVQKWTYEPSYQQMLTQSDPRFTTNPDPSFPEPTSYAATLTRWTYAGPAGDPNRHLAAIAYPDVVRPDGTTQAAVKETFDLYDANGRLFQHTDRAGVVSVFTYHGAADGVLEGFLQSVQRTLGIQSVLTSFDRDPLGRIVALWGPTFAPTTSEKHVTRLTLDALDRVIAVRTPAPFEYLTRLFYDLNGMLARVERDAKDENGNDVPDAPEVRTYRYDEELHTVRETLGGSNLADHLVQLHGYDGAGRQTVTRLPAGNQIRFSYNERNLIRGVTQADGTRDAAFMALRYDLDGLLIEHIDARGFPTRTLRDDFGRIVLLEDAATGVLRVSYDKAGNVTLLRAFERSAAGAYTLLARMEFGYDERGQRTAFTVDLFDAPLPATDTTEFGTSPSPGRPLTTSYYYEAKGRLERTVDPLLHATSYEYGLFDAPSAVVDAMGNRTENTYDAHGNLVRRVEREDVRRPTDGVLLRQNFFVTEWTFDELDRVKSMTDSLGNVRQQFYDSRDNVVRRVDPLGRTEMLQYDIYGRCVQFAVELTDSGLGSGNPIGQATIQLKYDPNGNLRRVTDALGRVTQQDFDAFDLRRRVTFPDGRALAFDYDATTNLIRSIDPNGVRRLYQHDGVGRVLRIDVDTSGAAHPIAGATFEHYEYDGLGRPRVAENSFAHCNIQFNSGGWLTSETTTFTTSVSLANALQTTRTYDDMGALQTVTYPSGRSVKMTRDDLGQLRHLDLVAAGSGDPGGGLGPSTLASFEYQGRLRSRATLGNGTATLSAYDGDRRLIELTHLAGSGSSFLRVQQLHDAAGNVRFRNDTTATGSTGSAYGYDSLYRLVRDQPSTTLPVFTAATLGPPAAAPPDPLPHAQATIDGIIGSLAGAGANDTWNYDLVGNRTVERAPGAPPTTYTVNALDEYLSIGGSARSYDANGNLLGDGRRTYVYDSLNQLVGVIDASGKELVRYEHDAWGRRVLEVAAGQAAHFAYDGPNLVAEYRSGVPFAHVVHEDRIDAPLHVSTGGGDYWYHVDPIGSVRVLTDQSGASVGTYRYSAFGKLLQTSGPYNRLRFAARPYDASINAHDLRAREYDAASGRFLQRDPRGMRDGTNLYAYAGNNPLAFVDSTGTSRQATMSAGASPQPVFSGVPYTQNIGLRAPKLTPQPYNWNWAPIDPEAGTQSSALLADPYFDPFRQYIDWVNTHGGTPTGFDYLAMGWMVYAGEVNREGATILGGIGRVMNKVDPNGDIAGGLMAMPDVGPALAAGAESLRMAGLARFATLAAAGTELVGPIGEAGEAYGAIRTAGLAGDRATQQFFAEYAQQVAKGGRRLGFGLNTIVVGRTAEGEWVSMSRFGRINAAQAAFFEQTGVRYVPKLGRGFFHPDVQLMRMFNVDIVSAAAKMCAACRGATFLPGSGFRPFTDLEKAQLYLHLDWLSK